MSTVWVLVAIFYGQNGVSVVGAYASMHSCVTARLELEQNFRNVEVKFYCSDLVVH